MAMGMFKPHRALFAILLLVVFSLVQRHDLVHAQDQTGFISLDCGLPENTTYSEKTTTLNYISDAKFIETGESKTILPQYRTNLQRQLTYVRSFPDGVRNCYEIAAKRGTRYLVRALFFYGNYDGQDAKPEFDVHIGVNFWDTVKFNPLGAVKEIVFTPPKAYVPVCLVNTGAGTPFISALELRPLKNTTYEIPSGALSLYVRLDLGSVTNSTYRYPVDAYDRIWVPFFNPPWTELSSTQTVDPQTHIDYWPPSAIMATAATPKDENAPMEFFVEPPNDSTRYYIYLHFAELQKLEANESRAFDITVNGKLLYGPVIPPYLSSTTIYSSAPITGALNYSFVITKLENSTLPPIINAVEIYTLLDFAQSETLQDDVDAMKSIKSTYGVKRNWDGDPCVPVRYLWKGLSCSNDVLDSPRITSLNLSSSGLSGNISVDIAKLTMLESLDLSNNNLTGPVPEFFTFMPNLKILNLEKNNLTGSVPAELFERSNNGSLSLSLGENDLESCGGSPCKKKKKSSNIAIPIAASAGGLVVVLLVAAVILFSLKKKKKPQANVNSSGINPNDSFESRKRHFSYSEVTQMTKNFDQILGKGGFGTVYYGFIEETNSPVAVKMLSASSAQGYQEFQAEVKLLMRVHHRNLTSLVGYCNEGTNMALIYEYMAKGNLHSHLSGSSTGPILTWEGRLQIAIDAAQGLEYLHNGCKPPIVHRDVKTSNILLAENYQAKLADFGLSRMFPTDGGSYVATTVVAGTPGYLDPEYSITNRLNEKSDVYSFGVVLLEIITGRAAIHKTSERSTHIGQWVTHRIANGDIKSVADPRLKGDFDSNSVWKAVEISMACVSSSSAKRPHMTQVVAELSESLVTEQARRTYSGATDLTNSIEVFSMNVTTELSPSAR